MNLRTNQKGFTIVELLIVIVVIAILAAISIVAYTGIQDRSRNSSALNVASQVAKKAEVAYALNGTYPTTSAGFTGESALESLKVTIGTSTAGLISAYPTTATFAAPSQTALDQFVAGTRVIYSGTTAGYVIYYRTNGSSTYGSITKGTQPTGTVVTATSTNLNI